MSFKCEIGLHSWNGCKCSVCEKTRDKQHIWNGCKCRKCGKIADYKHDWNGCECSSCGKIRDEQHNWSWDCEKCSKCGKTKENQHDWSTDCEKCSKCYKKRYEQHVWNGCKCTKCSTIRSFYHDRTKDCEICSICGETIKNQHDWSSDCEKCSKCGKTRDSFHNWLKNCEKCAICGKDRTHQHDWNKDCEKCSKCDCTKINAHKFINYECTICRKNVLDEFFELLNNWAFSQKDIKKAVDACKKIDIIPEELRTIDVINKLNNSFLNIQYFSNHLKNIYSFGTFEIVKFLILNGVDVNLKKDSSGSYDSFPLIQALKSGEDEIATFLIENGANINIIGEREKSPLIIAIEKGNIEMVKLLINNGADVNLKSEYYTPIECAIREIDEIKNTQIIELLINNGLDVNARNRRGYTPLHCIDKLDSTTPAYYKEMYNILLDHGADIYAEDNDGFLPENTTLAENDMRLILMKIKTIINRGDSSVYQYKSDSAEFNQTVNNYFSMVQDCLKYSSKTESYQATSKHTSGTYNIKENPDAVSKIAALNTPVSNSILHLIQNIKGIEVTLGWTCDIADKGTLGFYKVTGRAIEELEKRGNPTFEPNVFLNESNY